jgi:hypothetical protein
MVSDLVQDVSLFRILHQIDRDFPSHADKPDFRILSPSVTQSRMVQFILACFFVRFYSLKESFSEFWMLNGLNAPALVIMDRGIATVENNA